MIQKVKDEPEEEELDSQAFVNEEPEELKVKEEPEELLEQNDELEELRKAELDEAWKNLRELGEEEAKEEAPNMEEVFKGTFTIFRTHSVNDKV